MDPKYIVNARFVTQPLTGVQRYCYELTQHLGNAALLSPGVVSPDYPRLQGRVRVTGGYLAGHAWEQLALPLSIGRGDVLLSPAGCGPIRHPNHVVVIHDVAVLENQEWYSRSYSLLYRRLLPALSKRVRRIVTVSEFCKNRIVQMLGVPENKITVAWEASAACFFPREEEAITQTLERLGVQRPYFLAIGAVSPRKNFKRLLAAWSRAKRSVEGASLIIITKEGLRFSGQASLGALPDLVQNLQVSNDEDLARLYSGAMGLLFPSLYEGFGLPIVEAMACGCPVLTSDCTAMPEVAGDAAFLVNPLSEESIAAGIQQLARPEVAAELRSRGLKRCRQFSWAHTARITERALLN
jgi:glycosyltransferase involved in cell wall biosynthesis